MNAIRGYQWDPVYRQPKSISVGPPATYPIFCPEHDNKIFEPLEKPGFTYEPHKAALLAYRALCYKTWNPNMEKKRDLFLAKKDEETVQ